MKFRKYLDVGEYDTVEVQGLTQGHCFIFPKLDGIRISLWTGSLGELHIGNDKEEIFLDKDNETIYDNIYTKLTNSFNLLHFFKEHPLVYRLFGIWLQPEYLETYQKEAIGRFYITDIMITEEIRNQKKMETFEIHHYIPYNSYQPLLEKYKLNYVPCIWDTRNPDEKSIIVFANLDNYLIQPGKGAGAGIIVKNYTFLNSKGKQSWMEVLSRNYRENKNIKIQEKENKIEPKIVEDFCTKSFIETAYNMFIKEIVVWQDMYKSSFINYVYMLLLERYFPLEIFKKYNQRIIDFSLLEYLVMEKIKRTKGELFKEED